MTPIYYFIIFKSLNVYCALRCRTKSQLNTIICSHCVTYEPRFSLHSGFVFCTNPMAIIYHFCSNFHNFFFVGEQMHLAYCSPNAGRKECFAIGLFCLLKMSITFMHTAWKGKMTRRKKWKIEKQWISIRLTISIRPKRFKSYIFSAHQNLKYSPRRWVIRNHSESTINWADNDNFRFQLINSISELHFHLGTKKKKK